MILILKTVSWHCAAHYLVGTKQHTYTKLTTNSYLATSNANEASASSSVQSRPTLCDPTDCSTAGFPVHHQLPRLLKLMSILSVMPFKHLTLCRRPSPPAFNLSQHQGLFQWAGSSNQVAKVLEFQLQHQPFQCSSIPIFRLVEGLRPP